MRVVRKSEPLEERVEFLLALLEGLGILEVEPIWAIGTPHWLKQQWVFIGSFTQEIQRVLISSEVCSRGWHSSLNPLCSALLTGGLFVTFCPFTVAKLAVAVQSSHQCLTQRAGNIIQDSKQQPWDSLWWTGIGPRSTHMLLVCANSVFPWSGAWGQHMVVTPGRMLMATALGQPLGSSSFCSLCLIGTDGDTLLPLLLSHHNLSVVNMEK